MAKGPVTGVKVCVSNFPSHNVPGNILPMVVWVPVYVSLVPCCRSNAIKNYAIVRNDPTIEFGLIVHDYKVLITVHKFKNGT